MIKAVILQDFFSFRGENQIELNEGLNILLGINGSGKTTFLNAFRLLYEGVAGNGFEKLFQESWGGYSNVVNANHQDTPDRIKLTFVFDHEKLKALVPKSPFKNDAYYEILKSFSDGIIAATGEDSLNSLYLSNAMYLSSWKKKIVELHNIDSKDELDFEAEFEEEMKKHIKE